MSDQARIETMRRATKVIDALTVIINAIGRDADVRTFLEVVHPMIAGAIHPAVFERQPDGSLELKTLIDH